MRCTYKAGYTKGGVATVGALLFKKGAEAGARSPCRVRRAVVAGVHQGGGYF